MTRVASSELTTVTVELEVSLYEFTDASTEEREGEFSWHIELDSDRDVFITCHDGHLITEDQ